MKPTRIIFAGLFALGLIAALLPAGFAQQQAPPGRPGMGGMDPARRIDNQMTFYTRQLNLTADQQKKVRAILEEEAKAARSGSGQASRRDRLISERDQQKRQEKIDAKIKKVLTPDQAKKFDTLPRGRGQFGGAMGVDIRLDFLEKQLNLTAEQKTKLKPILEKNAENMRSISANRQEGQDRSVFRDQIRKENERAEKEIEAVLTPEQAKKYRAAQEEMRQRMMNRQGQDQGGNR